MNDEELRAAAIKAANDKRDFRQHLMAYVIVNLALVGIWMATNSGGYFWPIWPILGWGIGITFHGIDVYISPRVSEADIEREMQRLRGAH